MSEQSTEGATHQEAAFNCSKRAVWSPDLSIEGSRGFKVISGGKRPLLADCVEKLASQSVVKSDCGLQDGGVREVSDLKSPGSVPEEASASPTSSGFGLWLREGTRLLLHLVRAAASDQGAGCALGGRTAFRLSSVLAAIGDMPLSFQSRAPGLGQPRGCFVGFYAQAPSDSIGFSNRSPCNRPCSRDRGPDRR